MGQQMIESGQTGERSHCPSTLSNINRKKLDKLSKKRKKDPQE